MPICVIGFAYLSVSLVSPCLPRKRLYPLEKYDRELDSEVTKTTTRRKHCSLIDLLLPEELHVSRLVNRVEVRRQIQRHKQ